MLSTCSSVACTESSTLCDLPQCSRAFHSALTQFGPSASFTPSRNIPATTSSARSFVDICAIHSVSNCGTERHSLATSPIPQQLKHLILFTNPVLFEVFMRFRTCLPVLGSFASSCCPWHQTHQCPLALHSRSSFSSPLHGSLPISSGVLS